MISIENLKNDYGNETALIILSCRVYFKTATYEDLTLFTTNNVIDWAKFMALTKLHKIRPIVYKIINFLDIPQEYKNQLKDEQFKLITRCWEIAFETEKIISLLKKHHILAVPYKGATLSMQFFGDFVSRESSDIDLVIRNEDLNKTMTILKEIDYQTNFEDVYKHLGSKYYDYYKDFSLEKYNQKTKEFHLELHSAITLKYQNINPKAQLLLNNAGEQIIVGKTEIQALDPVSHFSAFIIHHGILDNFKFLKNIVDISQAIIHPSIQKEYQNIEHLFNDLKLKKILLIGEQLSYDLFGVTLNKNQRSQNHVSKHFLNLACTAKLLQFNYIKIAIHREKNRYLLQEIHWLKFILSSTSHFFAPTIFDFSKFKFRPAFFFLYYFVKAKRSLNKALNFIKKENKM